MAGKKRTRITPKQKAARRRNIKVAQVSRRRNAVSKSKRITRKSFLKGEKIRTLTEGRQLHRDIKLNTGKWNPRPGSRLQIRYGRKGSGKIDYRHY